MKITTTLAVLAAFAVSGSAQAQAASSCAAFRVEIERQQKEIAAIKVREENDGNVWRATYTQLLRANALALISINVDLMAQNKCPPLTAPISAQNAP